MKRAGKDSNTETSKRKARLNEDGRPAEFVPAFFSLGWRR